MKGKTARPTLARDDSRFRLRDRVLDAARFSRVLIPCLGVAILCVALAIGSQPLRLLPGRDRHARFKRRVRHRLSGPRRANAD